MITGWRWSTRAELGCLDEAARSLRGDGARALQLLGSSQTSWPGLDQWLTHQPVPVFGGLFPALIAGGQTHERGFVLIGHDHTPALAWLDAARLKTAWAQGWPRVQTLMVYVDPHEAPSALVSALYEELGAGIACLGGGAGSLTPGAGDCLVTPWGMRAAGAIVAGFEAPIEVAVAHGWRPLGPPLQVTQARGAELISLQWRPAFEVYQEVLLEVCGEPITRDTFWLLAKRHPLLVERAGQEGIVRDLLGVTPSGSLRCAGDLHAHTSVRLATSDVDSMLEAASQAQQRLHAQASPQGLSLVMDCISRGVLLGEQLTRELELLGSASDPLLGAMTIGEIASAGYAMPQVHNKTIALARLPYRSPA